MQKNIYVLGDVHSKFGHLLEKIKRFSIENAIIIQVGDFNIGIRAPKIDYERLYELNEYLYNNNVEMYVIRGNHDNPIYFKNCKVGNIKFIPDYTVLDINNKKILCVGRATSIDRLRRMTDENYKGTYFTNEAFSYDSHKIPIENIDVIITHTSPYFASPNGIPDFIKHIAKEDKHLINGYVHERKCVAKLYRQINKSNEILWYCGHFHRSLYETFNFDGNLVKFRILDELELKEVRFT